MKFQRDSMIVLDGVYFLFPAKGIGSKKIIKDK